MSDQGPGRNTLLQACGAALIVALAAAAAVALRAAGFGEPASDRTLMLVLIAAEGAFGAMLVLSVLALWFTEGWNALFRAILGGIGAGGLFVPATMFFFALKIRVIDGRIEADTVTDLQVGELFWSLFGAMGMFTPTGLRYLLPWPALAVAVTSAILLYRWPAASLTKEHPP